MPRRPPRLIPYIYPVRDNRWLPTSPVIVPTQFAEHLMVACDSKGISPGLLAEQVPCATWMLERLGRGEVSITTYGLLCRIAEVLRISMTWLESPEGFPKTPRVRVTPLLAAQFRKARTEKGLHFYQIDQAAGVYAGLAKAVEYRLRSWVNQEHLEKLCRVLRISDLSEAPHDEEWLSGMTPLSLWDVTEKEHRPVDPQIRYFIRSARKFQGISQYHLARRSGVAQSAVNLFERDGIGISRENLAKLASALAILPNTECGKILRKNGLVFAPDEQSREFVGCSYSRRTKDIDWSAQPLGLISDVELAERLGIRTGDVWKARTKRGIPACTKPHRDSPKPVTVDGHVMRIDWEKQPLGRIPDTQLAKMLGVTQTAVCEARRKRKIPPAPRVLRGEHGHALAARTQVLQRCPVESARVLSRSRIDWSVQPLGFISDEVLAKRLGCSCSLVFAARKRRGIPCMSKRKFLKEPLDDSENPPYSP